MADTSHAEEEQLDSPDDASLYSKRLRVIRSMRVISVLMLVVSLIWIVVGVITIWKGVPDSYIPYRIGGGCIGGGMTFFHALLVLCMAQEGKKRPKGKCSTTNSFIHITRCQWVMEGFLWAGLLVGHGISGIWGTIECALRTPEDDTADFSLNFCKPNRMTLYILSVCSLILGGVLFLLLICKNCFFCNNLSAFGIAYHHYGRYAYMDYRAGARETPHMDEIPAGEPLYIRTEHGFQQVDVQSGATPSAPPVEMSHDKRRGRGRGRGGGRRPPRDHDYDSRPYRPDDDDRRPHDRDRRRERTHARDHDDDRRRYDGDRHGRGRRPDRGRPSDRDNRGYHPRDRNGDEDPSNHLRDDEAIINENEDRTGTGNNVDEDLPPPYSEVVKNLKTDDV